MLVNQFLLQMAQMNLAKEVAGSLTHHNSPPLFVRHFSTVVVVGMLVPKAPLTVPFGVAAAEAQAQQILLAARPNTLVTAALVAQLARLEPSQQAAAAGQLPATPVPVPQARSS
jgi:hypothetical protein